MRRTDGRLSSTVDESLDFGTVPAGAHDETISSISS
jgi:hypothetical protein